MDGIRISGWRPALLVASLFVGLWSTQASAAVAVRVDADPVAEPISVFVEVTDAAGGPVSTLTAADFTLLVDGTAVSSPTFSIPPSEDPDQRVSVVFAMDMSQSVKQAALPAMQQAVTDFINSMQVGDYAAIVMFNKTNPSTASVVVPFTAIDGPGGTGTNTLLGAVTTNYLGSGSNILDGVALSLRQITESTVLPAGPKAVLLVSDGREGDPPGSTTPYADVITAANGANIPIFTVGVGNVNDAGLELLTDLATDTNATYLPAPTPEQIAEAYVAIANTLNNEYLLTFTSSITDCKNHTLEVSVTGQDPATATFARCTNLAPVISGAPGTSATAGQSYTFQPTASDPEGDALAFSVSGMPAWAAFNTATGALTGTPTAAGTHSGIVISVSDGSNSTSLAAFTITVAAAPPPPPPPSGGGGGGGGGGAVGLLEIAAGFLLLAARRRRKADRPQ